MAAEAGDIPLAWQSKEDRENDKALLYKTLVIDGDIPLAAELFKKNKNLIHAAYLHTISQNKDTFPLLHIALYSIILLIEEQKKSPVDIEIYNNKIEKLKEIITFLLGNEVSVNSINAFGQRPLYLAVAIGDQNIAESLLAAGAKPDEGDQFSRETPLHLAVREHKVEMIQLLLRYDADANKRNGAGQTPLLIAGQRQFTEIIELFTHNTHHANASIIRAPLYDNPVKKKKNTSEEDLHSSDESRLYPLHFEARKGAVAPIQFLLSSGFNPNQTNTEGDIPLHIAISHRNTLAAQLLLNSGSRPETTNAHGNTPLHLAAEKGLTEIVQALLQRGVNTNAVNDQGLTANDLAQLHGNTGAILLLNKDIYGVSCSNNSVVTYNNNPYLFLSQSAPQVSTPQEEQRKTMDNTM